MGSCLSFFKTTVFCRRKSDTARFAGTIAGRGALGIIFGHAGSTQPHPVLCNQDVLASLFDVFDPSDPTDLATCARSARVCRAWNEPASSVVWGRGVDIMNLFSILRRHSASDRRTQETSSWALRKVS